MTAFRSGSGSEDTSEISCEIPSDDYTTEIEGEHSSTPSGLPQKSKNLTNADLQILIE